WRLVIATRLRGRWRIVAWSAVVALVLLMAWVMVTRPGVPAVRGWFAYPAFIGWLLFGMTFVSLVVVHVVRVVAWGVRKIVLALARRPDLADPSRRVAISRITGGLVSTAVVGHAAYGVVRAFEEPELVDVPVVLPRLPHELDGFTILQITDVHIGGTIGRSFVEGLVTRGNEIGADLIALTGDFVDGSVAELADAVAPLAKLHAPHGVYFITGNHEYYSGAKQWVEHFATLGNIRVLRNEHVTIERDGHAFDLAGIDDHVGHEFLPDHGPDLDRALAGRDRSRALVLLAHQPRQVRQAARYDVDLQLSGHTHGGQVWPWHYAVALQQGGLLAGRYQIGSTQLYVSRGPGFWGPPVRVGAPPELTRVILRAGS
ncbi:MAG TPA: metallophosphoesterase, partial [Kofleriaceae bacterium]|nr:metallophosphoesterase [Kofleriaceae bacterium]